MSCYILIEAGYFHFKASFMEMDELAAKEHPIEPKAFKELLVELINIHNELVK